jgi:beta-galactosidase
MLWSENQNITQGELYGRFSDTLSKSVPHFFNINPPLADTRGYDYWLTRVTPETMPVNYGFTNWIGVVSHDETAFLRYLLLVKRARGINLEENWGFSKLYDWRYQYHHIPFYQTVLAMALGATGFNVYTGVSTDQWDDGIDTMQQKPYPDCSPITPKGEETDKSKLLTHLNRFLAEYQDIILTGSRDNKSAFGVYTPYSYLSCFAHEPSDFDKFGQKPVRSGFKALDAFMQTQLVSNRDFSIANVEYNSLEQLSQYSELVVVGGFFMSTLVQEKLISYTQQGGKLIWLGQLPTMDEFFKDRAVMSEYVSDSQRLSETRIGKGWLIYNPENPFESGGVSKTFAHLMDKYSNPARIVCDTAYTFLYERNEQKLVFVLSYLTTATMHTVMVDGQPLAVKLPAKGAGIFVVNGRELEGALVKGINDYDDSSVAPSVRWFNSIIQADTDSDISFVNKELTQWQYS